LRAKSTNKVRQLFGRFFMKEIGELYERYGKRLYNYFYYLTGDKHRADELTQETFFQAVLSVSRFRGDSRLSTWLFGIGRNVFLKDMRNSGAWPAYIEDEALERIAADGPGPEETAVLNETLFTMGRVLRRMSERQAAALLLRDKEGFSYAEIARITGDSLAAVKVTVHRARKKFREEFERMESGNEKRR